CTVGATSNVLNVVPPSKLITLKRQREFCCSSLCQNAINFPSGETVALIAMPSVTFSGVPPSIDTRQRVYGLFGSECWKRIHLPSGEKVGHVLSVSANVNCLGPLPSRLILQT